MWGGKGPVPSREVLCLACPLACRLELALDEAGAILECLGAQCKRGLPYARQELQAPVRILTATVLTTSSAMPLLPVRTDRPIPRDRLREAAARLAGLRVSPPVSAAQVLVTDLMGANVIACDDLPPPHPT